MSESYPPPTSESAPVTQQDLSRLRRLLWVFSLLFVVLITPSVVSNIQYSITEAKERAQYDVAKERLGDFNLEQFSHASRLVAHYVGPSVVNITTDSPGGQGLGSGVIVDADQGYIITNYHVVEGSQVVEVLLSDGRHGGATVIGADPLVDVAVIKTELKNLKAAEWGDSDALDVGDMVWAVGSPYGLDKSITFGIVSAKERRGRSLYQEFLQTDAAVNPGNSGGPLVNVSGEVIGINTAIFGRAYQGISFSIPSSIARESYEKLLRDGHVLRGFLGVRPRKVTKRIFQTLELEPDTGVLVVEVTPNTPAADAGLEAGDVILRWGGVDYSDPILLSRAIAASEIGSTVPVEIVRLGKDGPEGETLDVVVGARPTDLL